MDYFTMQICYVIPDKKENEVIEFKDIEGWAAVKELQKSIWISGFRMQQSPTAWELVSPYRIVTALVIKQENKYKP